MVLVEDLWANAPGWCKSRKCGINRKYCINNQVFIQTQSKPLYNLQQNVKTLWKTSRNSKHYLWYLHLFHETQKMCWKKHNGPGCGKSGSTINESTAGQSTEEANGDSNAATVDKSNGLQLEWEAIVCDRSLPLWLGGDRRVHRGLLFDYLGSERSSGAPQKPERVQLEGEPNMRWQGEHRETRIPVRGPDAGHKMLESPVDVSAQKETNKKIKNPALGFTFTFLLLIHLSSSRTGQDFAHFEEKEK